MQGMTSNSLRMMEKSLEFLWAKQAAHLDNIANAETPNYRVKTVTFEENFQNRLEAAAKGTRGRKNVRNAIESARWKVRDDGEITRMDDNGVNVNEQSVEALRTAYQQQVIMKAVSSDLSTLGAAIGR